VERRQQSGTTHFATIGEEGRTLEDIALAQVGEDMTGLLIDAAVGKVDAIPEIYGFTRTICDHFSHDERIAMLQMLWEVAYADGELHDYEASLLRQVAGLLYVTDQESGIARKRARERLEN